MSKLNSRKTILFFCIFSAATAVATQTFTHLLSFNGTDGSNPGYGSLIQGVDGKLYGTTSAGGANGGGTVFKITATGVLTTLYNFCSQAGCSDGEHPLSGLVLGSDGNLYGTTSGGSAVGNYGTVFKITPIGVLTTLYRFCQLTSCDDGFAPWGGLVLATDGNFYGTTAGGGPNHSGTVFKITPSGTLTTIYSFCVQTGCTDGEQPLAGLVQASNGYLYGTAYAGGATGHGTVFKITLSGALTTLYSFLNSNDGSSPHAPLVQGSDGKLYGSTEYGGAFGNGTLFKITQSGALTTLYTFCPQSNCPTGGGPVGALVQATDGNFYGTASFGGQGSNYGTVYEITPSSTLTTLHSFVSTDGAVPYAGLVQDTNGSFYGTTHQGGLGNGTVFSLSVGLVPFVETNSTSGKVGTRVIIMGNNLTGSTSVTFNGTKATFSVNSTGTAITTAVPTGATTGKVKVTTPSRILTSSVNFQVTPTISSFSPTSGPVGTVVTIDGESFTGATSLTFGGVKGTITSVSYTKITATVPTGAKTGKVTVTTPGGIATSSGTFTVT